jgi:polyferredoxin
MGFGAGAVLSQAQLWGWAQAGLPQAATVLLFLTAVALVTPLTTGRNVYCSHLCSHGSAQQLLARVIRPRSRPWLNSVRRPLQATLKQLRWLPVAFLVTAFAVSYFHLPFNLVDLEPFDAYLPAVAGVAALVWFALSLTASCFVPMAYCHYGCPTGALLDHLRFHRRSDRLSWRDALLAGCLVAAILLSW